jgi:hypothetical protein
VGTEEVAGVGGDRNSQHTLTFTHTDHSTALRAHGFPSLCEVASSGDKQAQAELCRVEAGEVAVAPGPAAGCEVITEAVHCPLLGVRAEPGPDRHAAADIAALLKPNSAPPCTSCSTRRCAARIHPRHRDRFADRGDGFFALIHPMGHVPEVLLRRVIPAFGLLLDEYNAVRPPPRQLRIRVVVHAGLVHYDANGCFGEALDTAFRLLEATSVKQALRTAHAPLALIISAGLGESIRSGRIGQAGGLVSVEVAGRCHQGLIQTLGRAG